eukprot:5687795-Amphidinium_carterae.1
MSMALSALADAAAFVAPSSSLPTELTRSAPPPLVAQTEPTMGPEFTRWKPRADCTEPRNVQRAQEK